MALTLQVRTNRINHVKGSIKDRSAETVQSSAEFMRDYAQAIAPVRTGAFAASIRVEEDTTPGPPGQIRDKAIVASKDPVGHLLEEGTRHMGPRPTFHPAAEATRVQFAEAMTHVADGA